MIRVATVYRKPVLSRKRIDGRISQREHHWERTPALEARDVEVLGVFWPCVYLDFGMAGAREFSLRTGRGLNSMRDWVLRPEDCRALRLEHAPRKQRKRREIRT